MHTCLRRTREPALTYIRAQLYAQANACFPTSEQGAQPGAATCQDEK